MLGRFRSESITSGIIPPSSSDVDESFAPSISSEGESCSISREGDSSSPETYAEKSIPQPRCGNEIMAEKEKEIDDLKKTLSKERVAKHKLYSSLVTVARELNKTQIQTKFLVETAEYASRTWYEGGIWRSPVLLPNALRNASIGEEKSIEKSQLIREPVSLTDLFLDLVIVTAFSRVGDAVKNKGVVNGPILAYFAIFWSIWQKESSYSTRFENTDLSSQVETLLACFAALIGSLSSINGFASTDATRIMMVAGFVAALHFCLHVRVAFMFWKAERKTEEGYAKMYAIYIMAMTFSELVVWCVGIFLVGEDNEKRWIIFLVGILCSLRFPKAFLANDFHAASSKRGVLFILLLGFTLQSVVITAIPFFDYTTPNPEQYAFIGSICFLLFCIKLLYVNDSDSIAPQDHAVLVNRFAAFFFQLGQFCLLFSTTVLWAGLVLLTHSYLAATAALSKNETNIVSGGFAAVILSIFFIKSMHIRRVPLHPTQQILFYTAYAFQATLYIAISAFSFYLCFGKTANKQLFILRDEVTMMSTLAIAALVLVMVSWLDEAIEMALYGTDDSHELIRVHPFGIWWCLMPEEEHEEEQDIFDNFLSPNTEILPLVATRSRNSLAYSSCGSSLASEGHDESSFNNQV